MIRTEDITMGGVLCVKTYSDTGYYIERDGQKFEAAIDPVGTGRTYTETDVPIEGADATEEDYLAALARLGVTEG